MHIFMEGSQIRKERYISAILISYRVPELLMPMFHAPLQYIVICILQFQKLKTRLKLYEVNGYNHAIKLFNELFVCEDDLAYF